MKSRLKMHFRLIYWAKNSLDQYFMQLCTRNLFDYRASNYIANTTNDWKKVTCNNCLKRMRVKTK